MSKFGWSYPSGCSGPPDDDRTRPPEWEALCVELYDMTLPQPLIDAIGACGVPAHLLEQLNAWGIPQVVLDRLENYVDDLIARAHQECPACLHHTMQAAHQDFEAANPPLHGQAHREE